MAPPGTPAVSPASGSPSQATSPVVDGRSIAVQSFQTISEIASERLSLDQLTRENSDLKQRIAILEADVRDLKGKIEIFIADQARHSRNISLSNFTHEFVAFSSAAATSTST